jgi:squalene-hopene/tetraprenyl-beta-curcumene cyclase
VVSYALPALIAIGQAQHHHRPSSNPFVRWLRNASRKRTLAKLEVIQPGSGGFLEATPLTSFVAMSLASTGAYGHPVVRKSIEFLRQSARPDGSWPIDTNLATWTTTLAINALCEGPEQALSRDERENLAQWLLRQQYRQIHPYTQAPPGAWAWTDLSGGVPDADDTAGALLALHRLHVEPSQTAQAIQCGVQWLLDIQNRDGGIPTFCRGWGALPFDRSGADLTAHALRAWLVWRGGLPDKLRRNVSRAIARAVHYLEKRQKSDGSWTPLWFGNQHEPREENPLYGTSRVVLALAACAKGGIPGVDGMMSLGVQWMLRAQSEDGGWSGFRGGPNSIEETALALESLAAVIECEALEPSLNQASIRDAVSKGTAWLASRVDSGQWTQPSPIGFYFANLWYFEKLYPQIYTVAALERCFSATALKNV